ncbi:prepilin peptidase [Saccharothrix saharensis]|uniref:prepilin peptidase n=1 Tax=Saccharothrix saharensis TaxID=571190 RepID=UPI003673FFB3
MAIDLTWSLTALVSGPLAVALAGRLSGGEVDLLPPGWRNPLTRESFMAGLVFGSALALLAYRLAGTVVLAAWVWFALTGVPLILIDWVCHRLPSKLMGLMLVGGIMNFSCLAIAQGGMVPMLRAVLAAVVVFLGALVTAIALPGSLGGGDVKLLATAALYLGWMSWTHVVRGVVLALVLAGVTAAALATLGRLSWKDRLAFGPAVVGGALITAVLP